MERKILTHRELKQLVYSRLLMAIPVLLILFFLPAGTLAYWEAWLYLAILFIPMSLVFDFFSIIYFLIIFSLPGFDQRLGWSNAPALAAIMGDLIILLGYGLFVWVLRVNRYASRTVEVEQSQQVISSGPYSIVRHPMYLSSFLMYLATPLALGSYWAMISALLIIPILAFRTINEEKVLTSQLQGYQEYKRKIRYRVIPGMW
jgi:protein-S-isoprenylcysteine O-methyltransferase Ste14